MRDPQKVRLYRAEGALRGRLGCPVRDAKEAGDYIAHLQGSDWYKRTWPSSSPVSVTSSFNVGVAGYLLGQEQIHLPQKEERWAYNTFVLCHELSHHVTVDGHGPWFAGAMLWIVEHAIGKEESELLAHAYAKNKVITTIHNYIIIGETK